MTRTRLSVNCAATLIHPFKTDAGNCSVLSSFKVIAIVNPLSYVVDAMRGLFITRAYFGVIALLLCLSRGQICYNTGK